MIEWDHHSDKEIQKQRFWEQRGDTHGGAWPWRHSSLGSFCEHALRGSERRDFLHPSVPPETFWMQSLDLPRIQEGLLKAYRGVGLSRASLHSYSHDPIEAISHMVSFRPALKSRNTIHEPQSHFKIVHVLSLHFLNRVTDKNLSLFHLVPHISFQIYLKILPAIR